jgi:hypothetical protein
MTDLSSKDCLSINETNASHKRSLKEKETSSKSNSGSNSPNRSPKSPKKKKHSSNTISNNNINDPEVKESKSKERKRKSSASPSKMLNLESNSNQVTDFALSKTTRCDFYGNVIKKGGAKYQHVTFIDKISNKSLVNIIEIDSFKKYNFDLNNDHVSCNCACFIF